MRDKASSTTYLAHVDGLRGVAILAVVVYHAWPNLLPGGFIGVDVFFVISGFLISRIILADISAGRFSFPGFLARRIRRLVPAAAVCFVAVSGLGALVLLPDAYADFGRSLTAASLMYANVFFQATSGYFDAPALEKPLLHTWSLAVEDQFYLTWPVLLFLLAPRIGKRWLLAMTVGLIALSLWHCEWMVGDKPAYAFYILMPRAWELLTGAALAMLASNPHWRVMDLRVMGISLPGSISSSVLGTIGLAAIGASFVLIDSSTRFPGFAAIPACLGSACVIASGLHCNPMSVRLLCSRPLVIVGLISYSLYLWHWPLLVLAKYELGRELSHWETAAIVAASLVIASLSWRFVEQHFRRPGQSGVPQHNVRVLIAGGAAMALLAVSGVVLRLADGLPERYSGEVQRMFKDMRQGNPLRPRCDGYMNALENDATCNIGTKKPADIGWQVAVLGDSNADHFVPLVDRWALREGLAGRQVTHTMCGPILGVSRVDLSPQTQAMCAAYQRQVINFIERNDQLRVVVLAANWASYSSRLSPNAVAGRHGLLLKTDPTFGDAFGQTHKFFSDRGIKVVVLGRIPEFEVLPARCIARAAVANASPNACGVARSQATGNLAAINAVFMARAQASGDLWMIDPVSVFCDSNTCLPVRDGVFMYRDRGHLSLRGALHLEQYLRLPTWVKPAP